MSRPALVVFGPNSSGKTSFIQRFLGIGSILPSGIGPVTARIVQLTYASAEQACFCVYETIEKTMVQYRGDLSYFFKNQLQPNWEGITDAILPHVKRPTNIDESSPEFDEWAKCFVEVSLPSNVLSLGIDIYDTPGFLSNNREQVLTDNLHKLVKRIKPTLVFLYDNATISDTDKSCFLAMKNALGSMERVSVFFLNTKADCISIANDYLLDDDPDNVPEDLFCDTLREKRQHCYELLLRRREMASEVLGRLPDSVDKSTCFDICTIPGNFDPWETYTNLINAASFQRIVEFAVESYSAPTLALARDILATVDDYFDLTVSAAVRLPNQWKTLYDEAIEWGRNFFEEYEKVLPTLTDDLVTNILHLFEDLKPQIAHQAALIIRTDDPIDALLQDNGKTITNYIRLAVQEQVIKVAANNVIITRRDEVKNLIASHFQQQRGIRKNELLTIAQRQILSEISADVLQQNTLFNIFLDNIIKLPMRFMRFWRSLPTRLSAYQKDLYNRHIHGKITHGDDDVYQLLDAMDAYATLSNETNRRTFADYCLTKIADELGQQKGAFGRNLIVWIEVQKEAFNKIITSDYQYITNHLSGQQALHNLISQLSGPFASVECHLLATVELVKRRAVRPIINEELGRGGFYSVHAAQWSTENNLAVKKLLHPLTDNEYMVALEAHYHRAATRLCSNYIVPLLYLYENNINDNQQELWLIMPKYSMSLRDYLRRHIHEISFAKVISFALTIVKALAEFHRLELVHRDLKASNIMLDDNEQCYIMDFGTAKLGLSNQTLLGTAPLPPEMIAIHVQQQTGTVAYDGTAADIFSFGLLLYEMLPKPTYERLDSNALLHLEQILLSNQQSDINTKAYEAQIRACLDKEPAKRPSAIKLISELTRIQHRTEVKPCMVCDDRERALRFVPCGHKVICAQCWESWCATSNGNGRCILCKGIVTGQTQDDSNATYYLQ
ncbi:unnamed protein product [Rotaria sp. Silwood2]|nr:unnamed protein product [Rotaria sp. Silwood2]CAF2689373.1 unnamed protein product [Rotaria sp. Silwood2]CAF3397802.1 unnamed protein product [Rotaria sp. Silwood2]CAF3975775.1 unnamed protein product [Rotaria sp. Silwood2]CAF4085001.1 unnamed protein product [Rotaria sp. Silwood2]